MYSQDIINQFIELRGKRVSIDKAYPQLHISRSTAVTWNRRYKARIAELRALHFEAACERIGLNYEHELSYAAEQLARVRAELKNRKLEYVSTEFLYNAEVTGCARVHKLWRMAEPPDVSEPDPENQPVSDLFPHQNGGEGAQNQPRPPTPSAAPAVHPCPSKDVNASEADTLHLEGRERVGDRPVSTPTRTPPNSPPVVANPNPL